jgi:hypothetical protein
MIRFLIIAGIFTAVVVLIASLGLKPSAWTACIIITTSAVLAYATRPENPNGN